MESEGEGKEGRSEGRGKGGTRMWAKEVKRM